MKSNYQLTSMKKKTLKIGQSHMTYIIFISTIFDHSQRVTHFFDNRERKRHKIEILTRIFEICCKKCRFSKRVLDSWTKVRAWILRTSGFLCPTFVFYFYAFDVMFYVAKNDSHTHTHVSRTRATRATAHRKQKQPDCFGMWPLLSPPLPRSRPFRIFRNLLMYCSQSTRDARTSNNEIFTTLYVFAFYFQRIHMYYDICI